MRTRCMTIALLTWIALPSLAQGAPTDGTLRGWGPRVGLSSGPDQIYFGAHFDLGAVTSRVRFQPNLELGVGDDRTVLATNFELSYRLRENWDAWTPYLGGGLGVVTVGRDDGLFGGPNHSDLGLSGLFGLERMRGPSRFFMEAKIGLVDAPDLKIGIGWTFY